MSLNHNPSVIKIKEGALFTLGAILMIFALELAVLTVFHIVALFAG